MSKQTEMRGFGGTSRVNHNSDAFYNRKLFGHDVETRIIADDKELGRYKNTVLCKNSTNLKSIPDCSVHLMVTSPPYNVGKDYDKDMDIEEYVGMLDKVFAETYRILVNGGRACINIANVGRKPYIPYHAFIINSMLKNGFLMRGEVIWDKGAGAGTSTAWGSWKSASNPTLRDTHEYILMFTKGDFGRKGTGGESTITRDEFMDFTRSVWRFQPQRAKNVNHPAPFPVELPRRCIQLYTFKGDVVFDPFAGSGTSAVAAIRCGRNYLMVESNRKYAAVAKQRIEDEINQTKLTG